MRIKRKFNVHGKRRHEWNSLLYSVRICMGFYTRQNCVTSPPPSLLARPNFSTFRILLSRESKEPRYYFVKIITKSTIPRLCGLNDSERIEGCAIQFSSAGASGVCLRTNLTRRDLPAVTRAGKCACAAHCCGLPTQQRFNRSSRRSAWRAGVVTLDISFWSGKAKCARIRGGRVSSTIVPSYPRVDYLAMAGIVPLSNRSGRKQWTLHGNHLWPMISHGSSIEK